MAVAATGALQAVAAGEAAASISGPCTATIAGENAAGLGTGAGSTPVDVEKGSDVVVTMQATQPMTHLTVSLTFAGISWDVKDKNISDTSWSEAVAVDDYAKYGKGLYLVTGTSSGNGFTCTGAALVNVKGNPLASVAGGVGLGLSILGIAGVGAAGAAAYRASARPKRTIEDWAADELASLGGGDQPAAESAAAPQRRTSLSDLEEAVFSVSGGLFFCWTLALPALLLTTGAMIGGGGGGTSPGAPGGRLPRAHWRPRVSIGGMVAGVLAGVGIGVLLQQYAVVYPTGSVAVTYLLIGLVAGILVPSIARAFAVRGVNRAAAKAEQQVAAARA